MHTEYVPCSISKGFFEGELYVTLGDSSAIVNIQDVRVETAPSKGHDGRGQVCVYIIERHDGKVLVEIPGQAVVGGLRTWIQEEQLIQVA